MQPLNKPAPTDRVAEALLLLPSETDAHYTMLVSAILLIAGYFATLAMFLLGGLQETIATQVVLARVIERYLPPDASVVDLPPDKLDQLAAAQTEGALDALLGLTPLFITQLTVVALVFVAAALVGFVRPLLLLSRRQAVPLQEHELTELLAALRNSGAATLARIYLVPNHATARLSVWRVDGRGKQHYILVHCNPQYIADRATRALLGQSWRSPSELKAGLLHGAGHIQNGDIGRVNQSLALQVAFYALIVLPTLLVLLAAPVLQLPLRTPPLLIIGQLGLLIALIWALWAALLRVREYYADWWAVSSADVGDDVLDLLERTQRARAQRSRTMPLIKRWWGGNCFLAHALELPSNHARAYCAH